jgi:hypothetical protein
LLARRATTLADLDRLLIAVFCTAEDPPRESAGSARRGVTDAELVTLAVAQEILDSTPVQCGRSVKTAASARTSWPPRTRPRAQQSSQPRN